MPKDTFNRLSEEKKKILLDAFFEEFALHTYNEASITRVVNKLGIAKGSIYQYFNNKKELYLFLIEYATNIRLENLDEYFNPESNDFFEQLNENFARKIEFDLQYPVYSAFLFNILNEKNNKDLGNLYLQMKEWIIQKTTEIIQRYQEAGKLNPQIDAELAAYMIVAVQVDIFDYIKSKYQIDFTESIQKKQPAMAMKKDDILTIVQKLTHILKHGLKV